MSCLGSGKFGGPAPYDFVLDGSNPLDEYQGSVWPTVWSRTNGGIFTYANGTTYFNRTDNLGTPRVSTDYTGAVKRTETMGPFGDGFTESFAGLDFTGFAGGVWDQENNGDHFGAREYAKTQGRWLTPDPSGLAAVDPSNPQTWNRHAYVRNNPVSGVDPTGLNDMNVAYAPWNGPGMYAGGGWGDGLSCTIDGFECGSTGVAGIGGLGGNGSAALPSGLSTVTPVPGGFAFPSAAADGSISYSFSFSATYNGVPLTNAGLVETLGLPTGSVLGWLMGPGANNGTPTTPVIQQNNGKSIPNVPPDKGFCSTYRDGTGAGDILYGLCMGFPNSPKSNCMRGMLLQQFVPNDNPPDLIFRYGFYDHGKDFVSCVL